MLLYYQRFMIKLLFYIFILMELYFIKIFVFNFIKIFLPFL